MGSKDTHRHNNMSKVIGERIKVKTRETFKIPRFNQNRVKWLLKMIMTCRVEYKAIEFWR